MLGQRLLILADDWTGASDTALAFFEHGLPTALLALASEPSTSTPAPSPTLATLQDDRVLSVTLNTRNLTPNEAYTTTQTWLAQYLDSMDADWVYRKMDSTLRGPFVADTLPLLQQGLKKACLVLPAYPQSQRCTIGGYHLLQGQPLHRTEFVNDPQAPVLESFIPELIKQQLHQLNIAPEDPLATIGQVPLTIVNKGAGAIMQHLRLLAQQGCRWMVCDAANTHDITQVALAFTRCQHELQLLPMGSAGFAHALADAWQQEPQGDASISNAKIVRPEKAPPLPITVISGSTTSTSQQQLAQLLATANKRSWRTHVLHPQPSMWYQPTLMTGHSREGALPPSTELSIITSCLESHDKQLTLELGQQHGFNSKQVARRIEQGLASMSAATVPQHHALVLCGGATAQVVLQQLGIQQLRMVRRLLDNVALLQEPTTQRWVVLKSGNMGDASTLVELVSQLKHSMV